MPVPNPLRVFISYARRDGASLAQRLQSDLTKQGFDVWLDTQRLKGGATWTKEIEDALDEADYLLALLTPASYVSEICRSEQLRAMRKGTCVIPLKAQGVTDIPLHLEAKNYRDFSDPRQYDARFADLLADIKGNVSATLPERYRTTPVRYLTAPPHVANYLERPEALHALRDALFAEDHRQPIALTALAGMGGIGKTVLAKALTDDEVVQRAFPDGIVWITAGKGRKRDFIEEMREVAKALGDDLSAYDTALACENQYRTTIANKAALIVVDDVWSKSDIEPLLAESPRSRFLFTTRDAAIGRFVGAREHRAELLDVAQSRDLLASWADLSVAELPAVAEEVIAECGRLPLALSVVGAMLRGADTEFWADTLDLLRKADLSAIQEQLPEGQQSFFRAVEVSLQSLTPEMQERYKALAVLLEDMAAPLPILQTLWNASEAEARRISRQLADRSLAQPDAAGESIRLHDLQLDYVRAQYPDKEALDLIHGAIRLSAHVIAINPTQFASQMVGRLLSYLDMPKIDEFTTRVIEGTRTFWLRPLEPTLHPPGTGLIRTLAGHTAAVRSVALSGDGCRAFSSSWDQTLKVWDVESGRELRTFVGHSAGVTDVALSADGRRAVSAHGADLLKVWDVESGRELRTLFGHTGPVNGVALSEDGRLAVSAGSDNALTVWDLDSDYKDPTLQALYDSVSDTVLNVDETHAQTVWDLASGSPARTLPALPDSVDDTGLNALEVNDWKVPGYSGTRSVHGVAVSADGRTALSASADQTVRVWDIERGRQVRTLKGHSAGVVSVALSADGQIAVSASADSTLKVWEVASGRELHTLSRHSGGFTDVALRRDGRRAISVSSDGTLTVWDLTTGSELHTLSTQLGVTSVGLSGDGRRAISASWDYFVRVWDMDSHRPAPIRQVHCASVEHLAVSGDRRRAVSSHSGGTLVVWDVESRCELRRVQGFSPFLGQPVSMNDDGHLAISACFGEVLKVWDVNSGREIRNLQNPNTSIMSLSLLTRHNDVVLSGDGRLAISAAVDGTLKVWGVESGRELRTFVGHSAGVTGVALSGDGRRAVSASIDQTLKVWEVESGRELRTFVGHSDAVTGVALSGDGRRAVSASMDRTLKVWEVESGRELRTLPGHSTAVTGLALSPDGQLVISSSINHPLSLWDVESGISLATFTCDTTPHGCAFINDRELIAGDAGGHVHFLRLEEPKPKN